MPAIRVTPEQMRNSARTVQTQASDWRVAVDRITLLVREMSSMWDGQANDAFTTAFEQDSPNFTKLSTMMNDYYTAIEAAAGKYDTGEQEVSNIVTRR